MEKAYDRMEWHFILRVLRCFGFSEVWVGWIEQCISIVSFINHILNDFVWGFSAGKKHNFTLKLVMLFVFRKTRGVWV